jgi:hypothetical protein
MKEFKMTQTIAQTKLMALHADAAQKEWTDAVVIFVNKNVPPEVVMRLKDLWDQTKKIGQQVYAIGKIIVMKIIDFIMRNPHALVGALIGVAVGSLFNMIPWIGPLIAPLAMAIGGAFGAIAGHRLDKLARGELDSYSDSELFADLITMAKEMWRGLSEIFSALKDYFINNIEEQKNG